MPTREQLTHERLDALINILASEGVLTDKEASILKRTKNFRESTELSKGLKERRK